MKKLLSIAAVAALFSTGAVADIVENEIHITGEVLAGAQVAFGSSPTGTLTGGTFKFEGADIDLVNMPLDDDTSSTQPIFVKTNSASGVKMTVTPAGDEDPDGGLTSASGAVVPVVYSYNGAALGQEGVLCMGTNDGSATVGNFVATATPAADQESGSYDTVLDVVIAAN